MMALLKRLFYEENGQGMVEYGLIIALVAVALIIVLTAMSGKLGDLFGRVEDELDKQITNSSQGG